MIKIAVVGAGASGLMAAVTAGSVGHGEAAEVVIFEQKDRLGKKILATGNGRCNLTNTKASPAHYYGRNRDFVQPALALCGPQKTLELFSEMGLLCKEEYGGRVFPYSQQASAVVDVFRNRIAGLGLGLETEVKVKDIIPVKNGFQITGTKNQEVMTFFCHKLILACGGKASPALGSDGSGFSLLAKLGHTIIEPTPALVQLKTDSGNSGLTKGLAGIKAECGLKAFALGREVDRGEGEVLFTDYGFSGSGILDISRALYRHKEISVSLDFMPDYAPEEVAEMLLKRQENLRGLTLEQYLVGLMNKKIGYVLLKRSGIERLSRSVDSLQPAEIRVIAQTIKNWEIAVTGHNGWANAQVTAGGAATGEFNAQTMESQRVKGLYCTGEILDIFGDCGGYNLQWAWSSGHLAGLAAAGAGFLP